MNKKTFKDRARRILDPAVSALGAVGISPTFVSVVGLLVSLYGAWVLAHGGLFRAGLWLLVAGLCDVLDGSLARHTGKESKFGAFIDSTLDRVSELAYLFALLFYYVTRPEGYTDFTLVLIFIVVAGSMLTSYTRARLEGLGYTCYVGLMERPERMTVLIVALLLGSRVLGAALMLLAVGSVITVVQRILHARRVVQAPDDTVGGALSGPDGPTPTQPD